MSLDSGMVETAISYIDDDAGHLRMSVVGVCIRDLGVFKAIVGKVCADGREVLAMDGGLCNYVHKDIKRKSR